MGRSSSLLKGYSIYPRDRIFPKGYGFSYFSKMGKNR